MAGQSPQDWSEHECSVFKINNSFTPPFYIKTVGGLYSCDDSSCFSEGEIYIILLRLKIKGVVATVEGSFPQSRQPTQLKIPLDYDGKFYIVSDRNASDQTSGETLTLRDIVSDCKLPQKVRVANVQFHGKNFLQNIRKSDYHDYCTLNLTSQETEDYFLGKSPDGNLVFLFSTKSNMNFYVKKTVTSDVVKSLQFNLKDLKYDIFVGNVGTPIVQCRETVELVNPPIPIRPPRATGLSTTQPERSPPPPLPKSGGKDGQNITVPIPQLPIPPLPSSRGRHPRQAHFDDKETTSNVTETKPPPPLPPRVNDGEDEAYKKQLEGDRKNLDTDEEYDIKVAERELTSPGSRSPLALPPIGMHVRSARSPQKGFDDDDQSENENLPDYEEIDSDSQSELVSEPTDTLSSSRARSLPNNLAQAPCFPSKKADFKLKITFPKSSRKKKTQESGDSSDDELTDDSYADQDFEKRPVKKRQAPQRRRDDPLPTPLEAGPSFQPPPIPTASPGRSASVPLLPPSHSGKHYTVSESDDSNKSDYEQVDDDDDDDVNSTVATSSLGMRSKIGVVNPIPPRQLARLNVSEEFPTDLYNLSVEAIAQTLRKLNIPGNVIENFREAQIDGQIFVCLDENILDDLGVGSLNKLKILKFKNGWRPKAN